MKTVTIYDSVSPSYPFELRERGTAYYSPTNLSAIFSDAGMLSQPLAAAKGVYRIGTEDFLVTSRVEQALREAEYLDEVLKLHLDLDGNVFHAQYDAQRVATGPGTFTIKIDSMTSHMGPQVKLQTRVLKARAGEDGTAQMEEEEIVPEKTFIQKYWIYALPVVLLLILGGGGEQS